MKESDKPSELWYCYNCENYHNEDNDVVGRCSTLKEEVKPTREGCPYLQLIKKPITTSQFVEKHTPKKKEKTKKNKEEDTNIYVSFFNTPQYMYEQCYSKEKNQIYFIKWDKKKQEQEIVFDFEHKGQIYKPIRGEELEKGAVILPEEPIDYIDDEHLEKEIVAHIHKWLDVPENYEQFSFYNILLSWVYDKFNTLSYTRALGDTGTGKSRFLFTLGHLHYKPMIVAGALTPAVVFRIINKWKGTLLIDEGDQENSEETNSFIKIMNCGYERGMIISRCNRNDPNKLEFFDVFCPKVITTRRRFDDKATEARCMTAIMTQTHRKDIIDILTREYFTKVKELQGKLLMWKFHNYDTIDPDSGIKVNLDQYEPRLRQVNRSFVSLFANNPVQLAKFKKYLDAYQEDIIQERSDTFEGILINVLAVMVGDGWVSPTPSEIQIKCLDLGHEFKYNLTARAVSKTLKGMGLDFKRRKIEGMTKNALIMNNSVLSSIFQRYIFDESILEKLIIKGYEVTIVTVYTETREKNKSGGKGEPVAEKPHQVINSEKNAPSLRNNRNYRNSVTQETIHQRQNEGDVLSFMGSKLMNIEDVDLPEELLEKMKNNGTIYEPKKGMIQAVPNH